MIWVVIVTVLITLVITVIEYPYVEHWLERRRKQKAYEQYLRDHYPPPGRHPGDSS